MNSKLRKSVNSNGKLRKHQSGKKYSILNRTLVCHRFNNQANHIHKSGRANL